MIFMGRAFAGHRYTLDPTPTDVSYISIVTLFNGIYDTFLASRNITKPYGAELIPNPWDFDTIMYALFHGNLHAGNVEYTEQQVSDIRVKRRKKGTYDWITLFDVPIEKREDFKFQRFDRYARSNTEYEYALIPVINGIEGNINTNTVKSQFDGFCILDRDELYYSILKNSFTSQKNQSSTTVATIGRKYPYVFNASKNNYYAGSVTGIFMSYDPSTCNFDTDKGAIYRHDMMDFLCNGEPKILKHKDGRMWLVSIINYPTEVTGESDYTPQTTFEWVEIANCESSNDLYENNFIDVNLEAPEGRYLL